MQSERRIDLTFSREPTQSIHYIRSLIRSLEDVPHGPPAKYHENKVQDMSIDRYSDKNIILVSP